MAAVEGRLDADRSWDRAVMARVVAGDDAALGAVYDQFSSFVYGLALRVTADVAAAEDVTQDVFVWLWTHAGAFDAGRGSLRSWLGVVTHRRAVDRIRRDTATRRRDTLDAARGAGPPPDIAEAATSLVVAQRIRDAVDLLPNDQKVAVQLAYFGGHTFRDVAVILGIPEGTAKSRLRIALEKLAGSLAEAGITGWA